MRRTGRALLFFFVSVMCIGCDRVTKNVAREKLRGSEPVVLAGGVVTFEYAENRGAFLNLGDELPSWARFWLLGVGTGIILAYVALTLLFRNEMRVTTCIALTLMLAGGVGNLFDRIHDGHVVDFMILRLGFLHTGVFNVADMAITGGALALFIGGIGRRKTDERAH